MKSISLKSLLCVAVLFCSAAAMAQPQQRPNGDSDRPRREMADPEQMAQQRTDRLAKQLGLSESQKSDLYKINLKSAEEAKAAQESKREAQQKMTNERKQREAKREEYSKSIMSLLNDKQLVLYSQMMSREMGENRGGKAAPQRAPRPESQSAAPKRERNEKEAMDATQMAQKMTDRMTEKLELSQSQAKKVAILNLAHATEMKDEMDVRHLEQQAREQDRKAIEAKREQYNIDVMSILTNEQKMEYVKILSNSKQPNAQKGKQGSGASGHKQEGRGNRGDR